MRLFLNNAIFILLLIFSPFFPLQAQTLAQRLSGRILLQVQQKGEAWYVDPQTQTRHFLGRPADAFSLMRSLGLGISEADFARLERETEMRRTLAGRILLRVEARGEAHYMNPVDLTVHYLGRPADAFALMRTLGLGITDADLDSIASLPVSIPLASAPSVPASPSPAPAPSTTPVDCDPSKLMLTHEITDFSRIAHITPSGGYVGPDLKTHSYLWNADTHSVPLYAPIDMTVRSGFLLTPNISIPPEYSLIFTGPCGLEIRFGHIDEVVDALRTRISPEPKVGDSRDVAIEPFSFKGGELIGHTAGTPAHNWDFGLYLEGSHNVFDDGKEPYGKDEKAVCPYDYYPQDRHAFFRSKFVGTNGSPPAPQTICAP